MAFTDAQQVQIRFFLGYPFPFQQLNPRLEGAIQLVGANVAAKSMVEGLLAKLVTFYGIDPGNPGGPAQVDGALAKAGIKSVESADDKVEFGTSASGGSGSSNAILAGQNDVARQYVGALSSMMGVEIANNVFGKHGHEGNGWAAHSNQVSTSPKTFLMGW